MDQKELFAHKFEYEWELISNDFNNLNTNTILYPTANPVNLGYLCAVNSGIYLSPGGTVPQHCPVLQIPGALENQLCPDVPEVPDMNSWWLAALGYALVGLIICFVAIYLEIWNPFHITHNHQSCLHCLHCSVTKHILFNNLAWEATLVYKALKMQCCIS